VCSPELVQRCPLVHPKDLHSHTLLHTDTRKHAWHDWLRLTGATDLDPTAGQRCETFDFLLQAAVSGFGGVSSPHPLVADDLVQVAWCERRASLVGMEAYGILGRRTWLPLEFRLNQLRPIEALA